MKKILLVTALLVSGVTIAQRNVVNKEESKDQELENANPVRNLVKNDTKGTGLQNVNSTSSSNSGTKGGTKGKARSTEEFQSSLNGIIHSDFGKDHGPAAKGEAKDDDEAGFQIAEYNQNSKKGIDKAEEKIAIAKERLEELKAAGKLSSADYDAKMSELDAMEKRKEEIKSSL